MKLKILVVDDDPQIRKQLKLGLEGYGYEVFMAANGDEATGAMVKQPDILILDISLGSEPDGIELCHRIREWSSVPIIILSVHDEDKTKIEALKSGADDYLVKPFSMKELEARVQAVLRRLAYESTNNPSAEIRIRDLYINLAQRVVTVGGKQLHLTPIEYNLLCLLAAHPGRVITYRTILQKVWGADYIEMTHYVRVFVNQLRKKLNENPVRNIRYILNEQGVGYRFIDRE